jgi:hypothetical protein
MDGTDGAYPPVYALHAETNRPAIDVCGTGNGTEPGTLRVLAHMLEDVSLPGHDLRGLADLALLFTTLEFSKLMHVHREFRSNRFLRWCCNQLTSLAPRCQTPVFVLVNRLRVSHGG